MNSHSQTPDDKKVSTPPPTPRTKTLSPSEEKNVSTKKNYQVGLFWKIGTLSKGLNIETIEKALDIVDSPNCNREDFDKVVESGVVPRFISSLGKKECTKELTIGICRLLSDIMWANSKHTKLMIDNGIIPALIKLMTSPNTDILYIVLHCLGNMSDELTKDKESILLTTDGFLSKFVGIFSQTKKMIPLIILKIACWTLWEFCRSLPNHPFVFMNVSIPFFSRVIRNPKLKEEHECLSNALWGIAYITEKQSKGIDIVLHEKGIVKSIIQFLNSEVEIIQIPALRILGNIMTGTDKQSNKVLKSGLLDVIIPLFSHKNPKIQTETVWMISNIVVGPISQLKQVFAKGFIPIILKLLKSKHHGLRRECSFVISNILSIVIASKYVGINLQFILSCIKGICYGISSDPEILVIPMLLALMETITYARKLSMMDVGLVLSCLENMNVVNLVHKLLEKYSTKKGVGQLCNKITINCSVLKSFLVTKKLKKSRK